jgi:hypothetical protein
MIMSRLSLETFLLIELLARTSMVGSIGSIIQPVEKFIAALTNKMDILLTNVELVYLQRDNKYVSLQAKNICGSSRNLHNKQQIISVNCNSKIRNI